MNKIKLSDLWRWSGTTERVPFFIWGALLFVLKFNLDRLVSWLWFDRAWKIFDYNSLGLALWRTLPDRNDAVYFATMLGVALPFLWAGVVLTLRRLRSVGFSPWWVLLFFVPVLKLIFFALLCLLPSRAGRSEPPVLSHNLRTRIGLMVPRSRLGSAIMAIVVTLLLTVAAVWLGTNVLGQYGWSLFVGLPFGLGFNSVLLYGYHERRSLGACLGLAMLTVLLAGAGLLLVAFEGIICLIMAAPLAAGMAAIGAVAAYHVQSRSWWQADSPQLFCLVVLAVPMTMGMERAAAPEHPLLQVKSSIVVNAPPDQVWRHVVSFSELPPPREWLFRLGIAYPVRAEIMGHGVGAERHCNFSTGPFVEPIEVWDEPRLLKFSVTANPAPMQEWTPYREIHPPHLAGFLESKGGQFLLTPLEGGRTRLEGTTWYQHHMWPAAYWQVWSDLIIHRIHLRVLAHVKQLAEADHGQ